ncbi:hypothetical protein DPSP01_013529 [Paraphaeosphaeria sporulosa]
MTTSVSGARETQKKRHLALELVLLKTMRDEKKWRGGFTHPYQYADSRESINPDDNPRGTLDAHTAEQEGPSGFLDDWIEKMSNSAFDLCNKGPESVSVSKKDFEPTPHALPPLLPSITLPRSVIYGLPTILSPTLPMHIQMELDRIEARDRADSNASDSASISAHPSSKQNPRSRNNDTSKPFSKSRWISIGKGAHLEIQDKEVLPYKLVRNLGHGASASVELVLDQNTKKVYARKVFKNVYGRTLKDVKQHFRNEIRIMRRLSSGHHVVNLYATYLAGRELALILDPAADGGDLAEFMQGYDDLQQELSDSRKHSGTVHSNGSDLHQIVQLERRRIEMLTTLKRAFGCLASGLEFIHKQTIRHKDIKPQNILIHQGNVLYTDFGFSLDHSTRGRSTTTGRPNAFTRRFSRMLSWNPEERPTASEVIRIIKRTHESSGEPSPPDKYFCPRCRSPEMERLEVKAEAAENPTDLSLNGLILPTLS